MRFALRFRGGVLLAVLFLVSAAHAEQEEPVAQAQASPAAVLPAPEPTFKRLVVSVEVLGVLLGRYGVQVEYTLTDRDAIAAYPWYLASATDGTADFLEGDPSYTYETQTRAGGLNLQYRRYFGGGHGASGAFIAPGLEVASFVTDTARYCASAYGYNNPGSGGGCPAQPPPHHEAFSYFGGSLDVGGQGIVGPGLVLSGSIGLHYRALMGGSIDENARPWQWSISHGPGLRPRLRVGVGWAF